MSFKIICIYFYNVHMIIFNVSHNYLNLTQILTKIKTQIVKKLFKKILFVNI